MEHKNKCFVPSGATRALVLVNDSKFGEPQGVWLSPYCEGVNHFSSFMDLMVSIDEFYTGHGFLQQAMQSRSFEKTRMTSGLKEVEATRYMTDNLFTEVTAEKSTFIVQVLFRQNATWQGKVKWVETGEETNFRSTLELLKLMDEAITKSEEKEQAKKQA